jgi:hypothetical protein
MFAYWCLVRGVSCSPVHVRTECDADIVESIILIPACISEICTPDIEPRSILVKSKMSDSLPNNQI